MSKEQLINDEHKADLHKPEITAAQKHHPDESGSQTPLATLQQQVGNRAIQRLLAQRSGDGPFDLDEDTTDRINRERGGGQALESNVQAKMREATGQDFGDVKVHTGPESHALNEQLSAKAFTTGQDIFFREGAYDPGSSSGQELIAHELTHVVQQSSGMVGGGGGGMTVNAPGDIYEQEADSVAKSAISDNTPSAVQRQIPENEEEVQAKAFQRQEIPEEDEEAIQKQEMDEEEEINA